jgi:ribosomal protein S18 acetylase RimI-like enzyme
MRQVRSTIGAGLRPSAATHGQTPPACGIRIPPVEHDLRPAAPSDLDFLFALYSTTMRDVVEQTWGWDEAWQRTDFVKRFAESVVSVVEVAGRAAGTVWVQWTPDCLYICELQVSPEFQGRGLGTAVLQHMIEQAASRGLPVELAVVPANPRAKGWYERVGFEVVATEPPFIRMRHRARGVKGLA